MQIKVAMTRNKNEQRDAKNNAELQTKWTKMTWKRLLDEAKTGLSRPN